MIPYLNMQCRVTIGHVSLNQVSSFMIDENLKKLGDTATIVLPRNIAKLKGKPVQDYIKVGDAVTIIAGYDDNLEQEFTGHVRHIGSEIPLVIECDDEFWPLKQNNLVKSYTSVKLKKLLQDTMTGYTIECPDMNLGKFSINNASSFRVLQQLLTDYGLYTRVIDKRLVVGFSWDWDLSKTKRHKYHFQRNVKGRSNLVWKNTADMKHRVEVKLDKVKGQAQKTVKYGSNETNASVLTVKFNGLDEKAAQAVAQAIYTRNSYDGFTGSFRGFGLPRTHKGDSAELEHSYEPEKNGAYLVEAVKIGYNSTEGFYRDNYISYRV